MNVGTNVLNLIIVADYLRLLWQELNKIYGGGRDASSVFVMTVGKKLSSCDYDITNEHAKLAAYNTFELVNETISCSTNYTPNGSWVSTMWKRLLLNQDEGSKETIRMKQIVQIILHFKDFKSMHGINYACELCTG